jgi:serine/threonine-protein kinase
MIRTSIHIGFAIRTQLLAGVVGLLVTLACFAQGPPPAVPGAGKPPPVPGGGKQPPAVPGSKPPGVGSQRSPGFAPPLRQIEGEEEPGGFSDWVPALLVVGLFSLVGVIAYLVIKGQGKDAVKLKKKTGHVVVTETQVDGYRLLNMMMTGQTSQVWEVAEISSGRHFALKMLLPEHVKSQEQRHLLFHEADVGIQIVHPKVIRMLTIVKDKDHPYVVMEFFPSTNLKLRLMHKDPFIKEHFKEIIDQAATALAYMHERGWVHRDVKPDNVLVNASAEVRIIDFALAQRMSRRRGRGLFGGKKKVKIQGTRSYMSPEQIRGEGLDARADVYSFGATMYELLTGRPPFVASNPSDLLTKQLTDKPTPPQIYNPEIADDLSNLIIRMLNKRREERPKDFHEFLAKFRSLRSPFKVAVAQKKGPR